MQTSVLLDSGESKTVRFNYLGNKAKSYTTGSYVVGENIVPLPTGLFINMIDVWCTCTHINKQSNTPYDAKAGILKLEMKMTYITGEVSVANNVKLVKSTSDGKHIMMCRIMDISSLFGVDSSYTPSALTGIRRVRGTGHWELAALSDINPDVSRYGVSSDYDGKTVVLIAEQEIIGTNGQPQTSLVTAQFGDFDKPGTWLAFSTMGTVVTWTSHNNCKYFHFNDALKRWELWDVNSRNYFQVPGDGRVISMCWLGHEEARFSMDPPKTSQRLVPTITMKNPIRTTGSGVFSGMGSWATTVTDGGQVISQSIGYVQEIPRKTIKEVELTPIFPPDPSVWDQKPCLASSHSHQMSY
jgi:hypothetical protein